MDSETPTIRLRLDVAYDGTRFSGWAKQPGFRSVQGEIETALATVFRRYGPPPHLTVAGRTDAGVHATGQVAHLDLTQEQYASLERPRQGHRETPRKAPDALRKRLNGIAGLNSDLHISRVLRAPKGFDARFSATWRRYEYRIADIRATRNPLLQNHTLWYPAELEEVSMDAAAGSLLGLHDFASYCKPREGATTIRTLQEFGWHRQGDGVLIATVVADAFCHSQVRSLVGACVAVGEGKLQVDDLVRLRDARERSSEFKVMPAKGLTLLEVGYPADDELAARAVQTRGLRVLSEPPLSVD
ncbi:tRNA pseudouridine(38-40) synthase TruA [Diaminobutyricimonas sp. TR449]|uniref:tRNA pseudouridine(38-40) synthase TruA n=1 Tax=Diaminobutyricimonas sp. TR449 TaxID=2708076 RepID=UPI001FBB8FA2|nr:tRNA pseudouridine(38-40) synthase TruA [Diaminobutyricimonas sp. TR449]